MTVAAPGLNPIGLDAHQKVYRLKLEEMCVRVAIT
jgi:hypothetical protein